MLYLISWSISQAARVDCWNVFGNMTPADDLKDAGDKIKVVGRWLRLSGAGGVCICDPDVGFITVSGGQYNADTR